MTVVISGANFNQEEQNNAASINYKNNTNAVGNKTRAGGVKTFASAVVSGGDDSRKLRDATYKSLLAEADDVKKQIMESATNAKGNLKALFNKLSGAEAVKIDEDGFNLTSADTEECVNIIEKIKIELAMHCEDYVPTGTPIDSDKIKQVTGSAGLANAVASKMSQAGIALTEDNQAQVTEALKTAARITPMSESVKNYMVDNQIPPTIDGIYQAEHAVNAVESLSKYGENAQSTGSADRNTAHSTAAQADETYNALKSQIEDITKEAGLTVNEQNLNNAKAFLAEGIPVTKENLAYKAQLDAMDLTDMASEQKQSDVLDMVLANMIIAKSAGSTPLDKYRSVIEEVADVIEVLNKSDIITIEAVAEKHGSDTETTFSIQDLKEALQLAAGKGVQDDDGMMGSLSEQQAAQSQVRSGYALLQEVRILMTADAGVFLAKQGMNLYTTSVYEMAMQLKEYDRANSVYDINNMEMPAMNEAVTDIYDNVSDSNVIYAQVFAVRQAAFEIAHAPEDVIGKVLSDAMAETGAEQSLTIAAFAQSGSDLRQKYDRAGKTYEAVGTQVRKDLGDSVAKAVKNSTDDILAELGMDNNERNRAAVRILASNSMEMTEENVNQVKELHETLNNLIDNMKPEKVLAMIRDNVNPLTDDIAAVNEYLLNMNEMTDEENSEKYSRFLYKLDKTDGITEDERRQFIGIYKMMNIFTKDAGRAIGALVKQNADITMENLMTAYESRKLYGMDVSLDENAGMAETSGTVQFYRNLFANTGSKVTPNTLVQTKEKQPIESYSVEEFCEAVSDNYEPKAEAEALEGYIEEIKAALDADAGVIRQIEKAGETVNVNNLIAAGNLLSTGMFPKLRGKNVSDGIEKIGHEDELEQMYVELAEESNRELKDVLASSENQTYTDIAEARMNNHEIGFIKNLALRHDYHIPVESGDGTGVIHLTLVHDDDNQGRISVEMSRSDIGKLSLEAKVTERKTDIFVMQDKRTETEQTSKDLKERLNTIQTVFEEAFDMDSVNIYQSGTDRMPERFYEEASVKTATQKLYGMAQVIVKVLSGRDSE